MSDRRRVALARSLAGVLLALALGVPMADAQQPNLQRLREKLLNSARVSNVLRDSTEYFHTHRWLKLPPDSIRAGALDVRYELANLGPGLEATLRAAAAGAASAADSTFGAAAADFIRSAPIVASLAHMRFIGWASVDVVELEIANGGGRSTMIRPPLTTRRIEDGLLDLIGTMATAHLLENAVQWGGEWVPAQRVTRERWEDAAVDLASSNAAIARTCYAGSMPACESALGLTKVKDPLLEWYSPAGWRALIDEWHPPKTDWGALAERAECVEKKVDSVCLNLSRKRPVPIPLTYATRSTLFATALERGGRKAFARLTAAKGTPLEVLAEASGVSADSLLSEWRSRVLASRPPSSAPTPLESAVFIGWALMFAVSAARRRP